MADEPEMTFTPLSMQPDNTDRQNPLDSDDDSPSGQDSGNTSYIGESLIGGGTLTQQGSLLEYNRPENLARFSPELSSTWIPGDTSPAVVIRNPQLHELEQAIRHLDEQLTSTTALTSSQSTFSVATTNCSCCVVAQKVPETLNNHCRRLSDGSTSAATLNSQEEPNEVTSATYFEAIPVVGADGSLLRTARFPSQSGSHASDYSGTISN